MSKRLNVGSGEYSLEGWINLDADAAMEPDVCVQVPPLPFQDGELDEIYAGHFLEHLTHQEAEAFLAECYRTLKPGGKLGILVPDTREIMRRYLDGALDAVEYPYRVWWPVADLDAVCALFLYSCVQGSPHRWMYDQRTLARAMEKAGFTALQPIDRYRDPRIPQGAWYQFGFDGRKEAA